jgi:hypothetical protein
MSLQHIITLRAIADKHREISTHMLEMADMLASIGRPAAEERLRCGRQHWAEAVGYNEEAQDMEDAWAAAQPAALRVNDTMIHRAGFSYIFTVWDGAEWEMIDGLPHYATEAEAQEAANEYVRSLA